MRRIDRELTDPLEVLAIIRKATACRIAVIATDCDPPEPYIIPLNYGFSLVDQELTGSVFYFHCAKEGRKLQFIKNQDLACLEIDVDHQLRTGSTACDWGMAYASFIAWGNLALVENESESKLGLDCLMNHFGALMQDFDYSKHINQTMVFKLIIQRWTAKRKK